MSHQYFNLNFPTSPPYFTNIQQHPFYGPQQQQFLQQQQQQMLPLQPPQQQQVLPLQPQQRKENDSTDSQKQERDKTKRDRWTPEQNQILVSMYVDNYEALESSNCNKVWPKILESVCNHGPKKTLKQVKVKIRNMKDTYKKCKDENKKSGNNLHKCQFYDEFDRILSQRDVVKLPEFFEVGAVKETQDFQEPEDTKELENETLLKTKKRKDFFSSEEENDECRDEDYEGMEKDIKKKRATKSDGNGILSKTRKRKQDIFSSSEEQNDEDEEYYEDLKKDVKKKRTKKQNDKPKNFQEQLLALQTEQMNIFERSERHFREFQQRMFEQQIEAEAKEKEKDREFFLKFGAILTGQYNKKD